MGCWAVLVIVQVTSAPLTRLTTDPVTVTGWSSPSTQLHWPVSKPSTSDSDSAYDPAATGSAVTPSAPLPVTGSWSSIPCGVAVRVQSAGVAVAPVWPALTSLRSVSKAGSSTFTKMQSTASPGSSVTWVVSSRGVPST